MFSVSGRLFQNILTFIRIRRNILLIRGRLTERLDPIRACGSPGFSYCILQKAIYTLESKQNSLRNHLLSEIFIRTVPLKQFTSAIRKTTNSLAARDGGRQTPGRGGATRIMSKYSCRTGVPSMQVRVPATSGYWCARAAEKTKSLFFSTLGKRA